MPKRMGLSLMAVIGLLWVFATIGIAGLIANSLNASPTIGIIVVSPIMGFVFHHIRNWIARNSDNKVFSSPIGMTIGFPVLIIILYFTI